MITSRVRPPWRSQQAAHPQAGQQTIVSRVVGEGEQVGLEHPRTRGPKADQGPQRDRKKEKIAPQIRLKMSIGPSRAHGQGFPGRCHESRPTRPNRA